MKNKPVRKIICFDFDDVITDSNPVYKLISFGKSDFGELRLGLELLEDNMNSRKFFKIIKELVKFGKGIGFDAVEKAILKAGLMKGAREAFEKLKESGCKIVIVSINDERIIRKFLKRHRLEKYVSHIYASRLGIKDGKLTGIISGDVIKTEKLGILKKLRKAYGKKEIVYIGDGLTDIPILKKSDRGILFCPNELTKAEVFVDKGLMKKEGIKLFLVEKRDLREILKFIFIPQRYGKLVNSSGKWDMNDNEWNKISKEIKYAWKKWEHHV